MRVHLKEMGVGIWKAIIGGSVSLKNKSKFAAQREGKKNDALALKTILSELSSPIKIIKGKESPKTLECIISKCDLENTSNQDK